MDDTAEHGDGGAALARHDLINLLANCREFLRGSAKAAGDDLLMRVTLADARCFIEVLRPLGHTASETFIRDGAGRLATVAGPGVVLHHVSILSFTFRVPGTSAAPKIH